MSLFDLILDELKPWLDARVNTLKIDNGIIISGTGSNAISIGFTGAAVIDDCSVLLQRLANQVFITFQSNTASAGATGTLVSRTAIPNAYWPVEDAQIYGLVIDGSVERMGSATIGTDGIITLGVIVSNSGSLIPESPFTSSGTCGIIGINGTYSIDFS